jgi:hypothetical protein
VSSEDIEKVTGQREERTQAIAIAQASLGPNHPNTLKMIEGLHSLPEE